MEVEVEVIQKMIMLWLVRFLPFLYFYRTMFHINSFVIKFKCLPLKLGQLTRVTDTSAAQARRGRDIQGIPWNRLHITRQNYRKTRLEQYKNYENIASSGELVDKVLWYPQSFIFVMYARKFPGFSFSEFSSALFQKCKQMNKGGNYYEFLYNTRLVKPTILHFQVCHPFEIYLG